jgi:amino acid adenylation domain-containing protein
LTGRSIDTVIAMIGSLRAGAVFYVVNEDLPQQQKVDNIRAAGSRYLVILPEKKNELEGQLDHLKCVYPPQQAHKTAYVDTSPNAEDLAYLVATSGTTGSPNIVMIEHGSLLNLLHGYAEILNPRLGDVRYQSVSASSDTFVLEVMLYLCFGASLHIEPELLDGGISKFDLALQARGISIIGLPSSLWREWVEQKMTESPAVNTKKEAIRAVICSMERTDPDTLSLWREQSGRNLLWINAYGPSEATCVACLFPLQVGEATPEGEIPIGRPLPNVRVYVLDSKHRRKPTGVIGEIAIGGAGVARGYANNAEKSKEKFIADPFSMDDKTRLYLTGDLGYFREDGNLVFVGRSDNQVKIRGHRIELEEVELALAHYQLVQDAAAVVVSQGRSTLLIAFYTSDSTPSMRALRTHLLTRLPSASLPHRFVQRNVIPRDRLGKVNRKLLTQEATTLVTKEALISDSSFKWKESDPLETRLSHLFGRILGISNFDVQDDFFLCGGDSLNAVALVTELEKKSGHTVSISDLSLHPSPIKLASYLDVHTQPSSSQRYLVALSPGGEQPPLLFFHGYFGNLFSYIPLAKTLGEDRPVWGLQAKEHVGGSRNDTIETMAIRYAKEIITEFANTPCYLCGYSLGGLIALETAHQLIKLGFPVKRLLIIDTLPFNLPMAIHIKMRTLYLRQRLKKIIRKHHNLASYARDRFAIFQNLITRGNQAKKVQAEILSESYYYQDLALEYQPQPLSLEVTLFKSRSYIRDISAAWNYLSNQRLQVVQVPWKHHDILQEESLAGLTRLFKLAILTKTILTKTPKII